MPMHTHLFLLGDADRVRDGIDKCLLSENLHELSVFSANLTRGIEELVDALKSEMRAEIIMAGGDDVLLRVEKELYSIHTHRLICQDFFTTTGCSISFGIAETLPIAYLNLRRAKSRQLGICPEEIGP